MKTHLKTNKIIYCKSQHDIENTFPTNNETLYRLKTEKTLYHNFIIDNCKRISMYIIIENYRNTNS